MLWLKSMHYGTKAKQSNKNESEHIEHLPTSENSAPETFTKFTVPIGQILRKLKDEPWFELPPPMKGDLTRLDYTKYCAFYQGPGHTTNGCLKWKQYLEKLTNEGRCDEYLDGSTKQPTQTGEVSIIPMNPVWAFQNKFEVFSGLTNKASQVEDYSVCYAVSTFQHS